MLRQFIFERTVSVRSFAEVMAVDPDLAVTVNAVKFDENKRASGGCGNHENFAIPAETAGQRATAGAGRMFLAELAFNAPVVWQIELAPLRIVETDVLSVSHFAEVKTPVLVEGSSLSGTRVGIRKRSRNRQ